METETEDDIKRRARELTVGGSFMSPTGAPSPNTIATGGPLSAPEPVIDESPPVIASVAPVSPDPVPPALAAEPITPPVTPPPVLTKDGLQASGRSTTSTRTIVDKDMRAADANVKAESDKLLATVELEKKAELTDAANRLKQAEIDAGKLDIEQKTKDEEAKRDAKRLEQAQAARAKIEADVQRTENDLKTAAADKRTYFQAQGTGQKILWGIALAFGAGERNSEGQNPGLQMLDKTMKDWDDVRTANLEKLEKKAATGKGLLAKFWTDYGEQAKAQKELEDAAGYLSVAEDIRKNTEARKGMMSAKAVAENERKAAEFEAKAAEKRLGVVEARQKITEGRAGKSQSVSTFDRPKAADLAAGGIDPALAVTDEQGNTIAIGRTKEQADKLRSGAADLASARPLIAQLKDLNERYAKLTPVVDHKQRTALESEIKSVVGNLIEKKKEITGAVNEGDENRNLAKMMGGWRGGKSEGANKAADTWLTGMGDGWRTRVRTQAIALDGSGRPAQPPAAPPAPPSAALASAPAAPSDAPAGAIVGTYKGRKGYRLGNQFFPTE